MKKVNRREFVTAAAMAGAGAVLPAVPVSASRKHGMWASSSSAPALVGREVVALQARPFPMQNVRLLEGPLSAAAAANRKYLKTLAPDRLLHTFRLTAGFPSSAEPLRRVGEARLRIARSFCRRALPFGVRTRFRQFR